MSKFIPKRKKKGAISRKREGENPFDALHREMNDLFEDFLGDVEESGRWPALRGFEDVAVLSPGFEVSETDDAVEIKAELPGMDEKDIDVTLDDNVLTIKGEKREEQEDKKKHYHVSEVHYGSFHRAIPVPEGIDRDRVKATFKKGTLKLSLPKTEQAKSQRKQIEISAE